MNLEMFPPFQIQLFSNQSQVARPFLNERTHIRPICPEGVIHVPEKNVLFFRERTARGVIGGEWLR